MDSHWCIPFTATFSKRRVICALWNKHCDTFTSICTSHLTLRLQFPGRFPVNHHQFTTTLRTHDADPPFVHSAPVFSHRAPFVESVVSRTRGAVSAYNRCCPRGMPLLPGTQIVEIWKLYLLGLLAMISALYVPISVTTNTSQTGDVFVTLFFSRWQVFWLARFCQSVMKALHIAFFGTPIRVIAAL